MTGSAIHILVEDLTARQVDKNDTDLLRAIRNEDEYSHLGAIGTGVFGLARASENGTVFRDAARFFADMRDAASDLQDARNDNSPLDQLEDLTARVLQLVSSAGSSLTTTLDAGLAFFRGLDDDRVMQRGSNFQQQHWPWDDLVRFRRSGRLATVLRDTADNDQQRAFAFGFCTHVATAINRNAFINSVVGGPPRNRAQLHLLSGMHCDVLAWSLYRQGANLNSARLHRKLPRSLSGSMQTYLSNAFNTVYGDIPGPASLPDWKGVVDGARDQLELLTDLAYVPRPTFFPAFPEILFNAGRDATVELLKMPVRPIKNLVDAFDGSNFSWQAMWDAIKQFFKDLFENLKSLVRLFLRLVRDAISAGFAFVTDSVAAGLYLLQLQVYDAYRQARRLLSSLGLLYPEQDEAHHYWTTALFPTNQRAFVHTDDYFSHGGATPTIGFAEQVAGVSVGVYPTAVDFPYPQKPLTDSALLNNVLSGFLDITGTGLAPIATFVLPRQENPATDAGPYPANTFPTLIDQMPPSSGGNVLGAYGDAKSPADTDQLNNALGGRLGDAVYLSRRLWVEQEIPNFNLEADRGYGYRTWVPRGGGSGNPLRASTVTVDYVD